MSTRRDPTRLRDVLEQLFRARGGVGESSPVVEAALQASEGLVAGWAFGDALRRLLGEVQHDVLARPGAWAALEAVARVGGTLATEASFRLDGVWVASAPIDARGEARALVPAPGPGTYRIEVTFGPPEVAPAGHAVLQVVDRPVALVDGMYALNTPGRWGLLVQRLAAAGFAVVAFDVSRRDRRALIRSQLARLAGPPMAVLTWDADAQHIEQLGFDLRRAFAALAVRRHRAAGVPIELVVTERAEVGAADLDGILRSADEVLAMDLAPIYQKSLDFLARFAAADPLTWRLDHVAGTRSRAGHTVHLELDNRRARERVFELIEGAQRSIHLQFYIVRPGAFTDALVTRLARRARAGVAVRFMADALFSDPQAYVEALSRVPQASVLTLTPIETAADVDIPHLKRRDHRKLIVIDDAIAVVSGRNAADEYYVGFDEVLVGEETRHEDIPWLDAHAELTGPVVGEVQQMFAETWVRHGGRPFAVGGATEVGEGVRARLVVHESLVDLNGLATYEALFDGARDHIYIVNDFPFVSILERALLRALARGVRVVLLTGSATARRADGTFFPAPLHRTLFEHLVKARLEPLMRAGAEVFELSVPTAPRAPGPGTRVRPYVHAKVVSVDGRVCSVGSANLDAAASFWESEANVLIEDSATTAALEAELAGLLAGSSPLDVQSEYWLRERLERAVVATLWPDWFYS